MVHPDLMTRAHVNQRILWFQQVPSQHTVRRFEIDRRDYTDFEIATMLWNKMNGDDGDEDRSMVAT